MNVYIISYLITMAVLLILDALWIGSVFYRYFAPKIDHLLAPSPSYAPAVIFYLLYTAGVTFFVIHPALQTNQTTLHLFVCGFLFGLVCYGTYDLTNHAVMRNWPAMITIADMLWGASMTGIASLCAYYSAKYFL